MNKLIVLISCIFLCGYSYAAERSDTSMIIVNYLVDFKEAVEKKDFSTDEMILEISRDKTSFYSRWERLRKERMDSLQQCGITNAWELQQRIGNLPRSFFRYSIFSNHPIQGKRMVCSKHYSSIYYDESVEHQEWEIADRDSLIMGYRCQMATCKYHGHTWNVWFTFDIPITSGPWKLSGLPGLILKASDQNGMCTFEAIGIREEKNVALYMPKLEALKSSKKQDIELVRLMYSDVDEYLKRMGINGARIVSQNGNVKKAKSKTAVLLEEY